MRVFLASLSLMCLPVLAQQDAYFDPENISAVHEDMMQLHGDSLNTLFMWDRMESTRHDGDDTLVWDAQGWIGYDIDKLWLKSEGSYNFDANDMEDFELQALWSHAVTPFWDVQAGLRHDFEDVTRDYAAVGIMGLAPYWFEVDAAAFLSDKGDASARLEAEYELRFTQRLILQPRVELNYAFSDDFAAGIGQGFSKVEAGLRLRYEIRREFAPYLGVAWDKSFGDTADLLRLEGKDTGEVSVVAGFRVWY